MKFYLVVAICPADKQKEAVDAAKAAGATGATLISARGTGVKEAQTFFGLTLDKPQEMVVILAEESHRQKIMKAIYDSGDMIKPGNGICFSLPIDSVMGLESQMPILTEKVKKDE
ncbi:Nitrogen regulatory protein P-II [hydrothermal vent metagenome]|uniref:Nitrogen regulatory protein P-II n=1 Tax=hydrothermal vent metagenome TaxID=652676 RepID=A0A3B1CGK9_9ZZZZ